MIGEDFALRRFAQTAEVICWNERVNLESRTSSGFAVGRGCLPPRSYWYSPQQECSPTSSLRFAWAQEETSFDFRETLGDDGQWVTHPRWGEVWIPADTQGDWRPYLLGHWVYTDEWGWYWVAEEEWGWITYHYGRWVLDRDYGLGWIWVPGSEWSPAWVSWRKGDEMVGWAPMPPDEICPDVQDDPDVWVFVPASDIIAPAVAVVVQPSQQATVFVSRTTIISRTRVIQRNGRAIVANPGVPPSFVAAKIRPAIEAVPGQARGLHGRVRG